MDNGAENTVEVKKRRGRPKGSVNRRTQIAREVCERLKIDPLEYLLSVVKNRRLPAAVRIDAAKACVGFVHPRLAAHQIAAAVQLDTPEERARLMDAVSSDPELGQAIERLAFMMAGFEVRLPPAGSPNAPVIDVTPEPKRLPAPLPESDS